MWSAAAVTDMKLKPGVFQDCRTAYLIVHCSEMCFKNKCTLYIVIESIMNSAAILLPKRCILARLMYCVLIHMVPVGLWQMKIENSYAGTPHLHFMKTQNCNNMLHLLTVKCHCWIRWSHWMYINVQNEFMRSLRWSLKLVELL